MDCEDTSLYRDGEAMSKLYFECRFNSYELSALDLPIEIRRPNLALVAQARLSQSIELKPGTYYIGARLPGGQELYNHVQVSEGRDTLIVLTSDSKDLPTNQADEIQYFLGGQQDNALQIDQSEHLNRDDITTVLRSTKKIPARIRAFLAQLLFFFKRMEQIKSVGARLRVFRGNMLRDDFKSYAVDGLVSIAEEQPNTVQRRKKSRWLSSRNKPALEQQKQKVQLSISGVNSVQLLQLLQPKLPPINIALPVSMWQKSLLVLSRLPNGLYSIEIHLPNASADLLLRYVQKGFLEESATLTASRQSLSELMLNLKLEDPIAATVAAYALLKFGDLDSLEDCTESLRNWFEWLPDGIAIRGEYLARIGKHQEALAVFLELPSRGLPLFSDGLSYVINRLRLYSAIDDTSFNAEARSKAQAELEQLQDLAMFVDFRQPLLTFTGLDPGKPDGEPLVEDVVSYEGLNVDTLFRSEPSLYKRLKGWLRNLTTLNVIISSTVAYFKAYGISLLVIGFIIPVVISAITIVFYLLPSSSLLPFLSTKWYVLLSGILTTCILWLVVAVRFSSFTNAKGANSRSYALLISRLRRLRARLGISQLGDNPTLEEMLRAAKVDPDGGYNIIALRSAYAYCASAWKNIKESGHGLPWVLGIEYLKVWIMLHRAEEALIEVDPPAAVIRGAIHSKVRFQHSVIGNRTQRLRMLKRAVTDVDASVKADGLEKMDDIDKTRAKISTSDIGVQALGRIMSRVARSELNKYRDNILKELIQVRNQVLALTAINGFVTYMLLCIALLMGNRTLIRETTLFYFIGFITGLLGVLYRFSRRGTATEDIGFSWAYLIAASLFSGLATIFGLLILGLLFFYDKPAMDLSIVWQNTFRPDQIQNYFLALITGLLSNMYFSRIWKKRSRLASDLKSSDPSHEDLLPIT